ncbi:TlpA family protein disulfide reductase [Corallibacter sp.]|uniref:TlpA family protein disulfide reductase n=1 Tax=Corallibacter sp. TaxID=2038084 RepID=UPI003AB19524
MRAIYSLLINLFLVFCVNILNAQNLKFKISNNYVIPFGNNTDLVSFNPLFKLNSNAVVNKTERKSIKRLPAHLKGTDLVYGFLFFKGNSVSEFDNEITFIVKNYNSNTPEIFIDKNGNLDFTDDGSPITFENDELIVGLENQSHKASAYHYKLGKSNIASNNASNLKNRFASKYPNSEIVDAKFWLTNQRLSVKLSHQTLNNKPITILLNDASTDGIYTFDTSDFGDRIVITEGHLDSNKDLNAVLRLGEPIDKNAVFMLYGKKYGIKHINPQGSGLELEETNVRTRIKTKVGSKVTNLDVELIDGSTVNLNDFLANNKFLLLDYGGSWCGGCIMQKPTIKEVFKTNKVNIVGVFDHDTKTSVANYVKKHNIKWPVALMTPKLKSMFSINAYPTYVLIAPNRKIVMIDLKSENILEYINKK